MALLLKFTSDDGISDIVYVPSWVQIQYINHHIEMVGKGTKTEIERER